VNKYKIEISMIVVKPVKIGELMRVEEPVNIKEPMKVKEPS